MKLKSFPVEDSVLINYKCGLCDELHSESYELDYTVSYLSGSFGNFAWILGFMRKTNSEFIKNQINNEPIMAELN